MSNVSFLDSVFLIVVLFGAFSISMLWIDFFYRLGEKIGWTRDTFWGSFYLASILTIFFIMAVLLLQYFRVNVNDLLSGETAGLTGEKTS